MGYSQGSGEDVVDGGGGDEVSPNGADQDACAKPSSEEEPGVFAFGDEVGHKACQ